MRTPLCLWTHMSACTAEAGLLLSLLQKTARWPSPLLHRGLPILAFLHRDQGQLQPLNFPLTGLCKLLPQAAQRRQKQECTSATNPLSFSRQELGCSTQRVELLAAAHLCAVCSWHSVYLRQKPPRNASLVRSLDLAFLLWASS